MTYCHLDDIAEILRTEFAACVIDCDGNLVLEIDKTYTDSQIRQIISCMNTAYEQGYRHAMYEIKHGRAPDD